MLGATEILEKNTGKADFVGYKPTYKQLGNYDNLFSVSPGVDGLPKNGGLPETLEAIKKAIHNYNFQVKALAKHLKADSLEQSCFNIWHFCIKNIAYKLDKAGFEEIRTPARSWKDRFEGIDCDDFTILTSSILLQMGYIPTAAIVAFNDQPNFQHIYTVVNPQKINGIVTGGVVVDPVIRYRFNVHPDNITKSFIMQIQELNGIGELGFSIFTINGSGNTIPEDYIIGFGGVIAAPTATTKRALNMQSEVIKRALQNINVNNPGEVRRALKPYMPQLRKLRTLILANGSEEQDEIAAIMPHVQDISLEGYYLFDNDEKVDLAQEALDGLGKIKLKLPKIKVPDFVKAAVNPLTLIDPKKNIKEQLKPKAVIERIKPKNVIKDLKEGAKSIVTVIKKVDPLLIAGRNGFLGLLKINYRNMARRLSIGLDKADALARGYSEVDFIEFQSILAKTEAFFKKAGGDIDNLHNAIRVGKNKKPLFAGKKLKELKGLGEPISGATVATIITAAAAFLKAVGGFFKGSKAKLNKEDDEIDPETGEIAPDDGKFGADDIKNILKSSSDIISTAKMFSANNKGYNSDAEADISIPEEKRQGQATKDTDINAKSDSNTPWIVLTILGVGAIGYAAYKSK